MAAFGYDFDMAAMLESMTAVGQLPYAQKVGEAKGRSAVNQAAMSATMSDMVKAQFDSQLKAQKAEEPVADIERAARLIAQIQDDTKRIAQQNRLDDEIIKLLS